MSSFVCALSDLRLICVTASLAQVKQLSAYHPSSSLVFLFRPLSLLSLLSPHISPLSLLSPLSPLSPLSLSLYLLSLLTLSGWDDGNLHARGARGGWVQYVTSQLLLRGCRVFILFRPQPLLPPSIMPHAARTRMAQCVRELRSFFVSKALTHGCMCPLDVTCTWPIAQ